MSSEKTKETISALRKAAEEVTTTPALVTTAADPRAAMVGARKVRVVGAKFEGVELKIICEPIDGEISLIFANPSDVKKL